MEATWLGDLVRHLGWADAALWTAVLEDDAAREEEPPLIDFIAWLWWGRPAADWSPLG